MREVIQRVEVPFSHSVDELWNIVADTPRWGEAIGFPPYQIREEKGPDDKPRIIGSTGISGKNIEWIEPPSNWVTGQWFEQKRLFLNSPVERIVTRADIAKTDLGCSLVMEARFLPRSLIGFVISKLLLKKFSKNVERLLNNADALIKAESSQRFLSDFTFSTEAKNRADSLAKKINNSDYGHGLADMLVDYISSSQEVDLSRMRPLELAQSWNVNSQNLVECFLQSARDGLLESSWEILCPKCRVPKSGSQNMSDIPDGIHCETCNIDYERDFASNVELSFSPGPAIRKIESSFFCYSGPGVFKHIKCQYDLASGETKSIPVSWPEGDYRIRLLHSGEYKDITQSANGGFKVTATNNELSLSNSSDSATLELCNNEDVPLTIVVEDRNWLSNVLTAERVTTIQAFRDLFSDQVLRPGDEIRLRNITFMFTDLVDSAKTFEALGDAESFSIVRDHFALLGDIIRQHQGSLVKTTGDGVHAAFLTPESGFNAAVEMQKAVQSSNRKNKGKDVSIRIGLNSGSSLSVTLNNQLDFYGSTVNMAARLEGFGEPDEIVTLKRFAEDPVVSRLVGQYSSQSVKSVAKGFDQTLNVVKINVLKPVN